MTCRSTSRWKSASLLALLCGLLLAGCASAPTPDVASMEDDLQTGGNPKWIYDGPLPSLQNVSIVVSLKGHTARVTGDLPATFAGSLPWYARTEAVAGKTRVTVVYPVATGAQATSNGPGAYATIFASPYVPSSNKAAWGGFPFLMYNNKRGLAFHGPITSADGQWKLLRGAVSHGCNRMQGEHVTELAHLMGINMAVPHKSSEHLTLKVKVSVIEGYDTWNGKYVDVDYPTQPGVVRPPLAQSELFATWNSQDLPQQVCAWNPKLWSTNPAKNAHHCDYAGVNKFDPLTGP